MTLSTKLNQAVAAMGPVPLIVADRPTYVTHLLVVSTAVTDETIQIWHGSTAVDATCILPPVTIVAGGWLEGGGIFLASGESLYFSASAPGLTITAYGIDGAAKEDAPPPSAFGFKVFDASGRESVVQISAVAALDDIGDVTLAGETDGDLLAYDAGAASWVNTPLLLSGLVNYLGIVNVGISDPPTAAELAAAFGDPSAGPGTGIAVGTTGVYLVVSGDTVWYYSALSVPV